MHTIAAEYQFDALRCIDSNVLRCMDLNDLSHKLWLQMQAMQFFFIVIESPFNERFENIVQLVVTWNQGYVGTWNQGYVPRGPAPLGGNTHGGDIHEGVTQTLRTLRWHTHRGLHNVIRACANQCGCEYASCDDAVVDLSHTTIHVPHMIRVPDLFKWCLTHKTFRESS